MCSKRSGQHTLRDMNYFLVWFFAYMTSRRKMMHMTSSCNCKGVLNDLRPIEFFKASWISFCNEARSLDLRLIIISDEFYFTLYRLFKIMIVAAQRSSWVILDCMKDSNGTCIWPLKHLKTNACTRQSSLSSSVIVSKGHLSNQLESYWSRLITILITGLEST